MVAATAVRRRRRVLAEVYRDLVTLSEGAFANQRRDRARRREEPVVLADHQHEAARIGQLDELAGGGEVRREGLLDQDMQTRLERGADHRHVRWQGGGDQRSLRM